MKSKTKRPTKEEIRRYNAYCSLMLDHVIQPSSLKAWLENYRAVRARPKKEVPS